jgi:hypothetical protein
VSQATVRTSLQDWEVSIRQRVRCAGSGVPILHREVRPSL